VRDCSSRTFSSSWRSGESLATAATTVSRRRRTSSVLGWASWTTAAVSGTGSIMEASRPASSAA
jgi:hypothetical protein